jgi:hypothetical protein
MRRTVSALALLLLTASCFGGPNPPPPGWRERPAAPTVASPTGVRAESFATSGIVDGRLDGATRGRVDEAGGHLGLCLAELEAARVTFTPVPDKVLTETCGLTGAGTLDVDRGTVARLRPAAPVMTCQTALALSVWRRQVVEPAAREIFGQDVVEIVHMGTYSCRSVSNRPGARPSAHSRAAAVDFAGVVLRDGTRIMVKDDWYAETEKSRFLKRIRDEGCRVFGTVLSPDYDAPHQDHLHLEPGGRSFCR